MNYRQYSWNERWPAARNENWPRLNRRRSIHSGYPQFFFHTQNKILHRFCPAMSLRPVQPKNLLIFPHIWILMELPASSSAFVKFDYEFIDELGFDFFDVVGTIFFFYEKKKFNSFGRLQRRSRSDVCAIFHGLFWILKKKKSGAWKFGKEITQNHNNRSSDDLGTVWL